MDYEPSISQRSKFSNRLSNNMSLLNLFTLPSRSGDGSNPFKRFENCFDEFTKAFMNLVDEDGNSAIEINIHGLNSCLVTYINNMNEIYDLIIKIREILSKSKETLLQSIKRGILPVL